jgi:seryl-tRNA synthetase
MINTKYVRENLVEIRETLKNRASSFPLDDLLSADEKWRKLKTELQELQSKRNKASLEISEAKKKGEDIKGRISALAELKTQTTAMEKDILKYEEQIDALIWNVPNVLDKSVPVGIPPEANKVVKKWGTVKKTNIGAHEDILEKLDLLDMERAAKVAGARFYYMKGDLVLLEQSLGRYALDFLAKRGYVSVLPPFMLRKKYYRGVAPLATFEDALYRTAESQEASSLKGIEHVDDELFMIGTAEHSLAAMHAEELIPGKALPLKYAGISPCFRREAGAHGKDQKGIFRVHQFDKVEQFIICRQEDEGRYFDELLKNSEDIWQALNVPYQLVLLCSGDTGHQMSKTIDIEGWFPGQKAYRELGSCSSAREWQSVRLDIKYEEEGKRKYAYTLNNTAISITRTLACLVENYANADGSIDVPDVLVPYMGKSRITKQ